MRKPLRFASAWSPLLFIFAFVKCDQNNSTIETSAPPLQATSSPSQEVPESEFDALIADQQAQYIEKKLAAWSPGIKDKQVPPDKIRDRSVDIEGDWIGRTGMDSAKMSIKRRSGDGYEVRFSTSGCLSRWQLKRTGTYQDGVLVLNRPVQEYCPITFQTLYAIHVDGKNYLLPSCSVSEVLTDLDEQGNSKPNTIGIRFYTYGRSAERRDD